MATPTQRNGPVTTASLYSMRSGFSTSNEATSCQGQYMNGQSRCSNLNSQISAPQDYTVSPYTRPCLQRSMSATEDTGPSGAYCFGEGKAINMNMSSSSDDVPNSRTWPWFSNTSQAVPSSHMNSYRNRQADELMHGAPKRLKTEQTTDTDYIPNGYPQIGNNCSYPGSCPPLYS